MSVLLLAIASVTMSPEERLPWPDGMRLHGQPVPPASAKPQPPAKIDRSKEPAATKPVVGEAKPLPPGIKFVICDPQMSDPSLDGGDQIFGVGSDDWIAALKMAESGREPGKTAAAITKMEIYFDQFPNAKQSLGFRLADLYFRVGRNADAYRLLAPLAIEGASEMALTRASIASALRGEVYPGQRSYCARIVLSGFRVEDRRDYLPQGESPRAVLALSYLTTMAVSSSYGDQLNEKFYANRALDLDPGNPVACLVLARDARRNRNYVQAANYLTLATARSHGKFAHFIALERGEVVELAAKLEASKPPKGS